MLVWIFTLSTPPPSVTSDRCGEGGGNTTTVRLRKPFRLLGRLIRKNSYRRPLQNQAPYERI
jgi:hypothetical protein